MYTQRQSSEGGEYEGDRIRENAGRVPASIIEADPLR